MIRSKRSFPSKVDLVIYDFDGVMTDNKVYVDQDGSETVCVNRSDGLAVSWLRKIGIQQVICSTEANLVVQARADKLGLRCFSGIKDKGSIFAQILAEFNALSENTIMIGNDINDLKTLALAGFSACPKDGHPIVLDQVDAVIDRNGGEGVVRAFADYFFEMSGSNYKSNLIKFN